MNALGFGASFNYTCTKLLLTSIFKRSFGRVVDEDFFEETIPEDLTGICNAE
jgi:hypothetical protein